MSSLSSPHGGRSGPGQALPCLLRIVAACPPSRLMRVCVTYTKTLPDPASALPRPRADLRTALTAGTSALPAAPSRSTCFARVLHIVSELFTKLACVAGTEIDLIRGAIESKRHGLCRLAPIEIVDEKHLHLLCHRIGPSDGATYFGC